MMKRIKISWFLNKYVIVLILFAIWMLFFDNNSLINRHKLSKKLSDLRADTTYYQEEIARYRDLIKSLDTDMDLLERLGREEYRMKRENEVIYVIQSNPRKKEE